MKCPKYMEQATICQNRLDAVAEASFSYDHKTEDMAD